MTNLMAKDVDHIIKLIEQITNAVQVKHTQSAVTPLQKKLKLYLVPRWDIIWPYTTQASRDPGYKREHRACGNVKYDLQREIEGAFLNKSFGYDKAIDKTCKKVIDELECIKAKVEYNQAKRETPAKEEKADVNIHIQGGIQAENVQIGNHASIQKQPKTEKNKGKVKAIVTIVSFLAALLTCIYFLWWLWTKFST